MRRKKKNNQVRAIANKGCPDCGGSGWVYSTRAAIPGGSVTQAVAKCECIRIVDFSKPKAEKRPWKDGKAAAIPE